MGKLIDWFSSWAGVQNIQHPFPRRLNEIILFHNLQFLSRLWGNSLSFSRRKDHLNLRTSDSFEKSIGLATWNTPSQPSTVESKVQPLDKSASKSFSLSEDPGRNSRNPIFASFSACVKILDDPTGNLLSDREALWKDEAGDPACTLEL